MRTASLFTLRTVKPSLVKYRACGTYWLEEKYRAGGTYRMEEKYRACGTYRQEEKYRKCVALKKSIDCV